MSKMEKLSIALTHELADDVRAAISSGDYASASEVMRDALREWRHGREERAAAIARIQELWNQGLVSGPSAERAPISDFLMEARERLKKVRAA